VPQKLNKNQTKLRLRLVKWEESLVGVFGEGWRVPELSERNEKHQKRVV